MTMAAATKILCLLICMCVCVAVVGKRRKLHITHRITEIYYTTSIIHQHCASSRVAIRSHDDELRAHEQRTIRPNKHTFITLIYRTPTNAQSAHVCTLLVVHSPSSFGVSKIQIEPPLSACVQTMGTTTLDEKRIRYCAVGHLSKRRVFLNNARTLLLRRFRRWSVDGE